MRFVHPGPLGGLLAQGALLVLLAGTTGLGAAGWVVGAGYGLGLTALVSQGLVRCRSAALGPADRVTLARAVLVGGVTALVADALVRPATMGVLVVLAAVALVLDGVDGWVARRTGTASAFGARFDMEVDAFLILVLSVHVARELGSWVLLIGAARYLFVAAGWLVPWMGATLPPRYWRKPVAAVQGIALTLAAADLVPPLVEGAAVVVALGLLTESFGRDVWWLHRRAVAASRARSGTPERSAPVLTRALEARKLSE